MNRELKFRAWDRKDNRFLLTLSGGAQFSSLNEMSIGLNEILLANNNKNVKGYEFYWFLGFSRFILQQFTGLKDKDGKEIYEGDIIRFYSGQPYQADYEVYWNEGGFSLISSKRDGDDFGVYTKNFNKDVLKDSVILGNIFKIQL